MAAPVKSLLPRIGSTCEISKLSIDIRSRWKPTDGIGVLLCGWCVATNTKQLWEINAVGDKPRAWFVGFVSDKAGV